MRLTSLLILAVVTVAMVIAAGWSINQRETLNQQSAVPALLYPDLIDQVNDISNVAVTTPKGAFTIERDADGNWTVPEKGGYPVMFETVKKAAVGIANLKPLEQKTGNPEKYSRLRLASPEPPDGDVLKQGTEVILKGRDGEVVAGLVVGKTKSVSTSDRDGWYYVRPSEGGNAWLVSGLIDASDNPVTWLNGEMPQVKRTRTAGVKTITPAGEEISVARETPAVDNFSVENVPEGFKQLHDTSANAVGSALGFMSFDDVKPADGVDFSQAHKAVYHTFDGLEVTVELAAHEGGDWARFSARQDDALDRRAAIDEAEQKDLKTPEDVKTEAARINSRFGGWAYKMPSYKVKDLRTGTADLLIEDKKDSDS